MKRRGFTLLEILCVIVLLAVIGLVLALLFREIFRAERLQATNYQRMLELNALADQFRADVAQAEAVLPEWQEYTAGPQTLILQMKAGGHLVYRWEDQRLLRRAFERDQFKERILPLGAEEAGIEFVGPGHGVRLVRLRVHRLRNGAPLAGQSQEIAAALAGDWR
jgi:prepilin-type N-terminal cleavage/methylation domain-containing protein